MKNALQLAGLILSFALSACAAGPGGSSGGSTQIPPLHGVPRVDLERFMGQWYVIASIPSPLEKGRVGGYYEFVPREDGRIDHRYYFHAGDFSQPLESKTGVDTVLKTPPGNAHWTWDFGWTFKDDVTIVYVDPEYRFAAVGHPSRNYGWILAREKYLSDAVYSELVQKLYEQDYRVERLLRVAQRPEFIGVPGFQ